MMPIITALPTFVELGQQPPHSLTLVLLATLELSSDAGFASNESKDP